MGILEDPDTGPYASRGQKRFSRRKGRAVKERRLTMDKNSVSIPAESVWDRVFQAVNASDEQSIVRFIRMVVANQPDLPVPEHVPCPAG
jgi:hypothetical protein